SSLHLQSFHTRSHAEFAAVNGQPVVGRYRDTLTEYEAVHATAGILDLSSRGRLCLSGNDRTRFLHGQVTNDINALKPGQGCYAALVTAKGKMVSDLNVCCLEAELLLDFEPGFSSIVMQRLEQYII